jgi:hypothetical protein
VVGVGSKEGEASRSDEFTTITFFCDQQKHRKKHVCCEVMVM